MRQPASLAQRTLDVARTRGVARARDFVAAGVPRVYLQRLCAEGRLQRLGRGLYQLPQAKLEAGHSLAEVARAVPHGVICLLSALQFHELTTQLPSRVWVMIELKARAPKTRSVGLRIVRARGAAFTAGIERHKIAGVEVPIYSAAKTIADCFKHRNKVGLDVAIEALREGLRKRKCSRQELWRYAAICRVRNVMRPYLEALS